MYSPVQKNNSQKANAYYNLGNALYQKGNFKGSIDAYKQALRIKPGDPETQHNLSVALKKQQQKQQQEQEQQQQQQNNKQDQQKQQQPSNNQNKSQQDQGKNSQKNLSKEEAEALLNIMDEEEKKVQSKLRQAGKANSQVKKDW